MKLLYCAGEQARVVLDVLERRDGGERRDNEGDDKGRDNEGDDGLSDGGDSGDREEVALLDDDPDSHGERVGGVEVVGGEAELDRFNPDYDRVLVAFGAKPGVRLSIAERVRERGFDFFNAIDPDATVSSSATVGEGVTVNAQSYVGPGATLGDHVLVDSAVNVSHDATLREGATVAPNATLAGAVTVGRDAYVGAGATVRDHVEIGERALVGAGAVVVDDVPPETTVAGVPAEPME